MSGNTRTELMQTQLQLKNVRLNFDLLLALSTFQKHGGVTEEWALTLFPDIDQQSDEIQGYIREYCSVISDQLYDADAEKRAMNAYNKVTTYWRLSLAHILNTAEST